MNPTPTYTKKRIELAIDDARYLARRTGSNAWTVQTRDRPGVFENITAELCPLARVVKAGWSPQGRRLDISAGAGPPRDCRKTYDVWDRSDPPKVVGQVKGQTRAQAMTEACQTHQWPILLSVAGPGSAEEIRRQLEREASAKAKADEKTARRHAHGRKLAERDRLALSRENSKRVTAEREARERGEGKPDRSIKSYHVEYLPEILGTFKDAEPFYLCEIRARSEEEAREKAEAHYHGAKTIYGGSEIPINPGRLVIRRLCKVVDQADELDEPTRICPLDHPDEQREPADDPRPAHGTEHQAEEIQAEPEIIAYWTDFYRRAYRNKQGAELENSIRTNRAAIGVTLRNNVEHLEAIEYQGEEALSDRERGMASRPETALSVARSDTIKAIQANKAQIEALGKTLELGPIADGFDPSYRGKGFVPEGAEAGPDPVRTKPKPAKLKPPKPYAYVFTAFMEDGTEKQIARVASSVTSAHKAVMKAKGVRSAINPVPLTERQYSDTYGSRKIKAH